MIAAAILYLIFGAILMICSGAQQPSPSAAPQSTGRAAAVPSPGTNAVVKPEFVVIIDPAHGGNDKGATLAPRVDEKDVALSFARAVRRELEQRGIATRLLRESDINLSLERRAELSNQQKSGIYVALHAAASGKAVRVYSFLMSGNHEPANRFIAWDGAQGRSVDRSAALATAVSGELHKKDVRAISLSAFLRPLNNIVLPAIAVEVSVDRSDLRSLESQKLQATVAAAIASGIAQLRAHPGGRP